jgi:hypothetical protein
MEETMMQWKFVAMCSLYEAESCPKYTILFKIPFHASFTWRISISGHVCQLNISVETDSLFYVTSEQTSPSRPEHAHYRSVSFHFCVMVATELYSSVKNEASARMSQAMLRDISKIKL